MEVHMVVEEGVVVVVEVVMVQEGFQEVAMEAEKGEEVVVAMKEQGVYLVADTEGEVVMEEVVEEAMVQEELQVVDMEVVEVQVVVVAAVEVNMEVDMEEVVEVVEEVAMVATFLELHNF